MSTFYCKGTTFVSFDRYLPTTTFSHIKQVKKKWLGKIFLTRLKDFLTRKWARGSKEKGVIESVA